MIFRSRILPRFWDLFNKLPEEIQQRAGKQYSLFAENPFHPSLHFKPVGNFWSVRVTDDYRALAVRNGERLHLVLDRLAQRVQVANQEVICAANLNVEAAVPGIMPFLTKRSRA